MYILLVDSQAKERAALRQQLQLDPELYLVGEISEIGDVLAQAQTAHPDVVLLEWELPGLDGANMVSALHSLVYPPKVIVFSEKAEAREDALAAGADAFVSKGQPVEDMLTVLRVLGRVSPCIIN